MNTSAIESALRAARDWIAAGYMNADAQAIIEQCDKALGENTTKPWSPYDGMTQEEKDRCHVQQVRQMMRDGA